MFPVYTKLLLLLSVIFFLSECVFGYYAQTLGGREWSVVAYISIVLACLFCALFAERSCEYLFTQLALVCTVCADFFLVYCDDGDKLAAMIFFSGTQIFYFLRLLFKTQRGAFRTVHIATRIAASLLAVLVTLLVLGEGADALSVVSIFYYAHLILNLVFAFITKGETPLFAIGLLLFLGCDTFVGFAMLDGYLPIAEGSLIDRLNSIPLNMAWIFYTPSQTLLALSLLPKRLRNKKV